MTKPATATTEDNALNKKGLVALQRDLGFVIGDDVIAALQEICWREQSSIQEVCNAVYMTKAPASTMETALRFFVLDYFRCAATEEGHFKAGHGSAIHAPALMN